MKKLFIALLLCLITSNSFAVSANDVRLTQRDATNTANITRDVGFPASSGNGVLVLNGTSSLPQAATLQGGITFDGTHLTTSGIPQANVSGLVSALSGKYAVPTGTTAQYLRGDGSVSTFPSIPTTFDNLTDGSTNKAFTSALLSKLNGIAAAATANSSDATLLNRTNHTGAQAISTVTGLQTALDARALQTDLTALAARVTALETWKGLIKIAKLEAFSATSDANGLFSFTTSSTFTSPKIVLTPSATAGAEGYHAHVTSVSGTTISGKVFKNKTQGVLIGGTIDPDDPAASVTVYGYAVQ